ncbi:MAG TPA: S1C family serine protease [Longimicrobium sp.]|uniref:S1C family serine protease n=1 Tax=Longimicrobium sp. TaxID=2029185 RepID=UPI002ED87112
MIAALLALQSPVAAQGGPDLPTLIERVRPAVVQIRTFDARGAALGSGSGFYGPDGRVITNAHVVEGAGRAEVFDADGLLQGTTQFAEATSSTVDLAVLPRMGDPAERLAISAAPPRVGERVVVIGSPLGLANTVSDGIVSGIRNENGQRLIQITAPISSGSSGGPVLNEAGEVVGVAVSLLQGGQNLNFAVSAADVRALLQSPAGRYAFEVPATPPPRRVTPRADRVRSAPGSAETSAESEPWAAGLRFNGRSEYVNRETLRILPSGYLEATVGRTYDTPHTDSTGDTYNLELVTYQVDCRGYRHRMMALYQFLNEELVYSSDDIGGTWSTWTALEWRELETFALACQLAGR